MVNKRPGVHRLLHHTYLALTVCTLPEFSTSLTLALLSGQSLAYQSFQNQIPNGNNVPHPCLANYMWPGLGHENRLGGGVRNPFGADFARFGYWWNPELCRADSDGDGRTNGEELGDPDCNWVSSRIPDRVSDITHPGICDPFGSPQCQGKNDFVGCEVDKFDQCDAINDPAIRTLDLRFSVTEIPPTETNYYCMTFDLPSDQDYHIVANEGIIDNANVLHHQLLYACEDDIPDINAPRPCGMGANDGCSIISAWTVGQAGQCFGDKIGYRVGRSTYRKVILEIHYNNPRLVNNYVDSSGLRLYYQPARSDFQDLVLFTTGQLDIEIPPGQSRVDVVGTCRGSCTNLYFTKPVYVISVLNHMHYMGRSMKIELFRQGRKIADLSNEEFFNYDSPVNHDHDPPIEIRPGDEIKTTCTYSSLSSNRYVYRGEGTSDEMCFGFLTMYPRDAVTEDSCSSFGPLSSCEAETFRTPIGSCNWAKFVNLSNPESGAVYVELKKNCNLNGFCRPECEATVRKLEQHPCMSGEAERFVKAVFESYPEGVELLGRYHSCAGSRSTDPGTCSKDECDKWCHGGGDDGGLVGYDAAPKMAAVTSAVLLLAVTSSLLVLFR